MAILWLTLMTTAVAAQGLVNFANSPSTLISAQTDAITAPIAGPVGSYYFALLVSTNPAYGFTFTGLYASNTMLAGRFSGGGGVAVPGWLPGAEMLYEIAGWSSSLGPTFDPSWLTNPPAEFGISGVGSGIPSAPWMGIPPLPLFGGSSGIQSGFVITEAPGPVRLQDQNFIYGSLNGTVTIVAYVGAGGTATVPNTVNSMPVTRIADRAFYGLSSLTNAIIPNTVTNIGNLAFWNCGLTSLILPNGLFSIGSSAFGSCASLASITVPDSVVAIGERAFDGCSGLTSLDLGNGLGSLAADCIDNCTALTNITLGSSLTNIPAGSFPGCVSLTTITINPTNRLYSSVDGVLFNKSQTILIECPPGRTGNYLIPDGISDIGDYAFSGCGVLDSVTIPNSATTIGNFAFSGCSGLTRVAIPRSVANIGDGAFMGCKSLTGVTIPERVTNVRDNTFSDCQALASIAIPSSVTNIGRSAFYDCWALANVTIPASVANLGDFAFQDCHGLASVTIPGTVATIGDSAFSFCTSMTNATVGSGISSLPLELFSGCASLAGAYFEGDAPRIDPLTFEFATNVTIYYLPGTIGWGPTLYGLPTAVWVRRNPQILGTGPNFGVGSNGFAFAVAWATNSFVVIEGCTDLTNPLWRVIQTNSLSGGTSYFSDPLWRNHPMQFYRVRSP